MKYNQALKDRFETSDVVDPILLNDIDDCNEWLTGEMGEDREAVAEGELVFDDDTLTWGVVANAIGAGEPEVHTRQQTRLKKAASTSRKGKETAQDEEEEEVDDVETEEEEEEQIYKSSTDGSDNDEEEDFGDDSN